MLSSSDGRRQQQVCPIGSKQFRMRIDEVLLFNSVAKTCIGTKWLEDDSNMHVGSKLQSFETQ